MSATFLVRPLFLAFSLASLCGVALSCVRLANEQSNTNAFQRKQLGGDDLPEGILSLTFDDGPGERTRELAEYLSGQGIAATFFMVGTAVEVHTDVVRRVVELGHLVGNHTYSHRDMSKANASEKTAEIVRADAVLAPFLRDGIFLFRAPAGKWDGDDSDEINKIPDLNRYVGSIRWEVGGKFSDRYTMDWNCWKNNTTIPECGRGYLNEISDRRLQNGLVLMHDIHNQSIDLVKWIVPRLKAQGIRFVRADMAPKIGQYIREAGGRPLPFSASPLKDEDRRPPRFGVTPFRLFFLAREGRLAEEGIPAGTRFCAHWRAGSLTARDVVSAAAYQGYFLSDGSTVGEVQSLGDTSCRH